MNMGLSHATLNKYGIGGKYSRVGSMTFPNTTIQSLNLRKTAQEPIRVKMVDLLPSLTDTEENCLMSLICCICQQKEEKRR